MKKALIIIDYVNDFVADNGKLTCGKVGQEIECYIKKLVEEFSSCGDFIAVAKDSHEEGDKYSKEAGMFPLHCVDTIGRELFGSVKNAVEAASKSQIIQIDKTRYSAFCGTPLDLKLKEREVCEIHLVGVCTDICVLHTAIDAYNLGYKITVHKSGVASFNQSGHEAALSHFANVLAAVVE